jgi:hypothetical protein
VAHEAEVTFITIGHSVIIFSTSYKTGIILSGLFGRLQAMFRPQGQADARL